jgi:hypothetical protein
MWLPTTIIAQSSSALASGQTQTSAPTGISSSLPKVITNPDGAGPAPNDTTEIQIGFLFPLNYPFVVNNPLSSAQIFKYLPIGLATGLGLDVSQVTMNSLLPLDTTQEMGFITTLALAYIPTNMVSTLTLDIHVPNAPIYTSSDSSVNTLMSYINPSIPLTPGSTLDNGSGATATGSSSSPSSSSASGQSGQSGVFNTSDQSQTSSVSGATAGIAMAAIGGSAVYGVAMFLIARRYKKRKQAHRRSSSLTGGEMRQTGSPALMGGAYMSGGRTSPGHDRNSRGSGRTGNSARTAQISAPMMAENSLGWN